MQVDLDGAMPSLRYPMEVDMVGDSATTLRALLPLLGRKPANGWRQGIEAGVASWWRTPEDRAMQSAEPINPQRVFWGASRRLPDNCIMTGGSGSVASWYGRDIRMRRGMTRSLPGSLASPGRATPCAVAARTAFPGRTVIAFIGDGAMRMNGLNGMITASKHGLKSPGGPSPLRWTATVPRDHRSGVNAAEQSCRPSPSSVAAEGRSAS